MKKIQLIPALIIVLMVGVGIYLYPTFPDEVPIHFNAQGQPDSYSSKAIGLFLLPILTLVIYAFFITIPYIEVYKKNLQKFYSYFVGFELVFIIFMASLHSAILIYVFYQYNLNYFIIPAIAILLFYLGYILQYSKRNFFFGIRTPWTLSSDLVWEKTHKIGSIVIRAVAVILLLSLVAVEFFVWALLILLLGVIVFLFTYSFVVFSKLKGKLK